MILIPKIRYQALLELSVRSVERGLLSPAVTFNFSLWAALSCKGVTSGRCHCIGQFAALLLLLIYTFRTQDLLFLENSSRTPKAPITSRVAPTDSGEGRLCSSLRQEDKDIVLLPSLIHKQCKGKRAVHAN